MRPAGGFWADHFFFELEKRPAGAFWAEGQIFKSASNLVLIADLQST